MSAALLTQEDSTLYFQDFKARVQQFVETYFERLFEESYRWCQNYQLDDFVEDALSISLNKLLSASMKSSQSQGMMSYFKVILKHTCIDEWRRRHRQAIPMTFLQDDGHALSLEDHWMHPDPSPEQQVIQSCSIKALILGFDRLPQLLAQTHRHIRRDLDVVYKRHILQWSWKEIGSTHRQSAARGRALLRGWIHALCGSCPTDPQSSTSISYWKRGFEAGQRHRRQNSMSHGVPHASMDQSPISEDLPWNVQI